MKKSALLILVLLMISFFSFASAELEDPTVSEFQQDAQQIQDIVEQVPITEEGEFDESKLNLTKSKAEERIDKINLWLEENASWLKVLFGMVPEVSWLFAINFLLILAFIAYFRNILVFFSFFSEKVATLIGIVLAAFAVLVKIPVSIARFLVGLFSQWWVQLIIFFAVIALLFFGVWLGHFAKQIRENREKYQERLGRKLLKEETEAGRTMFTGGK